MLGQLVLSVKKILSFTLTYFLRPQISVYLALKFIYKSVYFFLLNVFLNKKK
jgi:hypothetical protein